MTFRESITVNEGNSGQAEYEGFRLDVVQAVQNGRPIRLKSYTVSDDVEMKMDAIIHHVLHRFERLDMKPLVYTIVKELLINGTRANLKRVFFQNSGFDMQSKSDYERGSELYRQTLVEEMAKEQGEEARRLDLYVTTDFHYRSEGLLIEVTNTVEINTLEEERLRKKLERAMQYDSILDFYMDHHDPSEGAGLGLAMIVTMLKSEGIDPGYFRIFSGERMTTARIEIPFTVDYKAIRSQLVHDPVPSI